MAEDALIIGIDLGSSKTAVVASNGRRETFASVVGFPRDQFARAALGRDILFGRPVHENRLALRVVRPFEKGALKYVSPTALDLPRERVEELKSAARLLVEHAVSLTRPPKGARLHGVIGVPSRAGIDCQQVLLHAAEEFLDSVAIVPEPFAVAYGVDMLQNTLVVDIGAGTTDICPMTGAFPTDEDQVTVHCGGDLIDEVFLERLAEAHPEAQLSKNMVRDLKERFGYVHDVDEPIVTRVPIRGEEVLLDVTEPLTTACRVVVPPIIEGIKTVLGRVDPEFRSAMLRNVLLSGGGSQLKGLDRVIEKAFVNYPETRVIRVYDWVYAGATGAMKLALSIPREGWDSISRTRYAPSTSQVAAAADIAPDVKSPESARPVRPPIERGPASQRRTAEPPPTPASVTSGTVGTQSFSGWATRR